MALVTCSSSTATAGVLDGSIMRPLSGMLTADLRLDQPSGSGFAPGTAVTINGQNGYSIAGVVDPNRSGDFLDAVHIRVLGGAGGMQKPASPRSYVQPGAFARDVVNGLVADAGEKLSSTADTGFLGTNLAAWSVIGGQTVKYNLKILLGIVNPALNWRFLPDGTLWIGFESWQTQTGTYDVLNFDPKEASYEIGQESPFILPGTNLSGVGNINRVVDRIENGRMRSRAWLDFGAGDRGVAAASDGMARQALAGVDFYAHYVFQVQAQSGDLTTVDVLPVGDRNKKLLGGMQRVPVRFGTGFKIQVSQGSYVLVGWDGGNPEQPYVLAGLSGDTAQSIQLGGNTHPFIPGNASELGKLTLTVGGTATLAWVYLDGAGNSTSGSSGTPIFLTGKQASIVGVG